MDIDPVASPSPPRALSRSPSPASRLYIEIEHHPHSGLPNDIIPLDSPARCSAAPSQSCGASALMVPRDRQPWAPFRTRVDFEWAETMRFCVLRNPNISQFETADITEEIDGEERVFTIHFRDPWKWILEIVTDPSLAKHIVWYPHRKYLVVDGMRQRLRDEVYSADLWWDMQSKLPHISGMHHCLVPVMLWLDEGRVTSHTNMYPMLLRSLSLPSAIRNGSGNGGSWLAGFMAQVKDHHDPDSRTASEKLEFAFRKRRVYHRVLRRVFTERLGPRSRNGEGVRCGDETPRVLFPCIPITSLDGKEADAITGTRAALAHFPCGGCLVRSDQLTQITMGGQVFELRTTESMRAVYEAAQSMQRKSAAEAHLQAHGLHAVENALWDIANSDPYASVSYDLLHSDDLGKFGKKLWPAVQKALNDVGNKGLLTRNMAQVPRWPGLKHWENVTTKQMNNGQEFLDIEKSLLPCIAQLLPRDSPWVHIIRAHQRFRMIMGLHCVTDDQIARKEKYQAEYERWATKISERYPEYQFDFPKQHAVYHSTDDIKFKGAPSVYCTRANEGHHQENRDSATRGNHHDNDKQVSEIDATKEAMAKIRITVDAYDKELKEDLDELATHAGVAAASIRTTVEAMMDADEHWRLGAPGKLVDSRFAMRDATWLDQKTRDEFDGKLRTFLRDALYVPLSHSPARRFQIRRHDCIYVHYTSAEDWTDQFDILRCNPAFQARKETRLDCVNVNLDPGTLDFARMLYLFRCQLPSRREEDVALVRLFKPSRWKPRTAWENCRVFEDGRTIFMLPKYFIRGVHLVNAFGCGKETSTFYLNDIVDSDWFLRAGN
ncbi:hypothetical protein GGX14DRAFT_515671 [Mycena pura]|uniref:Uncharacterized protein n=1 Tax=Mycena pura TaxID=153505 RepID=A0AAD6VWS2_9AGAR|nr:hypothetical protein GGX14DRAFT_515671 [Mycena pura]